MRGTLLITLTLTSLVAVPLHFVWMRFVEKNGGSKKSSWDGSKTNAQMMVVDGGSHICSEENMFVVSIYTSEKREKREVPFSQPSRNYHLLISIHSISGIYDTRWAPTSYKYRVTTSYNSIYRGYKPQLPIYKATYRGPITPFITIVGAHLVETKNSRQNPGDSARSWDSHFKG